MSSRAVRRMQSYLAGRRAMPPFIVARTGQLAQAPLGVVLNAPMPRMRLPIGIAHLGRSSRILLPPAPTIGVGSVLRCEDPRGCALYPGFTMTLGVSQGSVRRASYVLEQGSEVIALGVTFPAPDDPNAPIISVSVKPLLRQVWPGSPIVRVPYTGVLIDPRTGTRSSVAGAEGYVLADVFSHRRELPEGPEVR